MAPDIQAAIIDEDLPEEIVLFDLAIDTPLCWQAQHQRIEDAVAKVRADALEGRREGETPQLC